MCKHLHTNTVFTLLTKIAIGVYLSITPLHQVSPDPDETTQIVIHEIGSADIDRSLIEEYEVFITDDNQLFVKMNCSNETEITILDSQNRILVSESITTSTYIPIPSQRGTCFIIISSSQYYGYGTFYNN